MPWSSITPGRACIAVAGLCTGIGPYVADWNETHIYNPRWPPHAKFHNGQTMTFGLLLGLLTLHTTFRVPPSQSQILTAAVFGGLYWVAGLSAILYPEAKAMDPEFGEGSPQLWGFAGMVVLVLAGWWVESGRLGRMGVR